MLALPTTSPVNVAALDEKDPNAGGAYHLYAIQFGGPDQVCVIQFQHGARGLSTSVPGVFDDDLLAILESRLSDFQEGPFACQENATALDGIRVARRALADRVAARIKKGVLGVNLSH